MQPADIFALIGTLQSSMPLSKEKVEQALGTTLKAVGGNEYFVFLAGPGNRLADGLEVGELDLRLSKSNTAKGLLTFRVGRRCVSPASVRAQYSDLQVTGVPRGRSADEETTLSTMQRGVRLAFGFKESQPDCLSTVTLESG